MYFDPDETFFELFCFGEGFKYICENLRKHSYIRQNQGFGDIGSVEKSRKNGSEIQIHFWFDFLVMFGTFLKDHIQNMSRGLWGTSLNQLAIKRDKIIESLSTYSDKTNITIINANGNVNIKKRFRNPKITEGAIIIINKKEEVEPFSLTNFSTNIASIITSLATLVLLLNNN